MKKILILLILTINLIAWEKAKVVTVIDGDTLLLKQGAKRAFKVRLIGLDTFETSINHRTFIQLNIAKNINIKNKATIKQVLKYGYKAKRYVESIFLGKYVYFLTFGEDKYKRKVVWIKGLNWRLIRNGLAIYYPNNKLPKNIKSLLLKASKRANLEKRGIYELR